MTGFKEGRKWLLPMGLLAAVLSAIPCVTHSLYPEIIFDMYGRRLPDAWTLSLMSGTVGDFHRRLGPPTHDLTAKDAQIWVVHNAWGDQELNVISGSFADDAHPDLVAYDVKINHVMVYSAVLGGLDASGNKLYAAPSTARHPLVMRK
jgi:hypothetical protein